MGVIIQDALGQIQKRNHSILFSAKIFSVSGYVLPENGETLICSLNKVIIIHIIIVSHHPPVSAFAINIPTDNPAITVQGHCGQRTTFASTGVIKVTQVGFQSVN
jgi:hypothetical protein